ncbi:hypothetical protein LXL04_022776 [Taraxacum kok-saghyz]
MSKTACAFQQEVQFTSLSLYRRRREESRPNERRKQTKRENGGACEAEAYNRLKLSNVSILEEEIWSKMRIIYTADVWSTSSAAEGCRCGPQTVLTSGVNEPSRARIPPSSARARLSCCRLELELGSFKVWYPSSSSAREKCKKLELGSARLVYLSSLNEPRLGSSSFMLFELD